MKSQGNGFFSCVVPLGDTLCEQFHIAVGKDSSRGSIYPAVDLALSHLRVEGPSDESVREGRRWLIDGRARDGTSEGQVSQAYEITLEWHDSIKRIAWKATSEPLSPAEDRQEDDADECYAHKYYISGSFLMWKQFQIMHWDSGSGTHRGSFQLGASGAEDIHFVRDMDPKQTIHPASSSSSGKRATSPAQPVRGPDPFGVGKSWKAFGSPGEEITAELQISGGAIHVTIKGASMGTQRWMSQQHGCSYFVSLSDGMLRPMSPYSEETGSYSCTVVLHDVRERFQIVIDEDRAQVLYPAVPDARPGESFTRGPDGNGADSAWLIDGVDPGTTVTIFMDTRTVDRRFTVWYSAASLGDA
jgi:hypothetical protein